MIEISNQYFFLSKVWHLAYYIPNNRPQGSLSNYILKFKENETYFVKSWSRWAKDELAKTNVPFDFIIRALGGTETQVTGLKGLDTLGRYLAQELNAIYCPEVLQKIRPTPSMHTIRRKTDREAAMLGSYIVADHQYNFNNKNILIIDDVCTSGTTIMEIIRSLRDVWPDGHYYFFFLAKTNYNEHANDNIEQHYFKAML